VETTLCVWKSHSARVNSTLRVKMHLVRVAIALVRVVFTLCVCKLRSACINNTRACRYHTHECHTHTHKCQTYSRVCTCGKDTLCVKSHSACENLTLRIETNFVRVEITLM
jgi:hypothetical protein